ncbi:MAG: hypothetical protein WC335_06440 [Candidatus Omnitrophota bacterium]
MKKRTIKKHSRAEIFFLLFIFLFLPVLAGWENINLHEYLESAQQARSRENNRLAGVSVPVPEIPAYTILEKTTAAFGALKAVRVNMETWIEDPSVHIKLVFTSDIQNGDNYKTNGRVAVSSLIPGSVSTSQWVQTYEIRGIPFTWDREKREWVEKELEILGSESKKILQYTVLSSLFTINDSAVDPSSVRFMGVEKRNGTDCYVLQYSLAQKQYKQWGITGNIDVKVWIGTGDFLPVFLRLEGKIGHLYILQAVNYSGFNAPLELNPPAFITERVRQEKDDLKKRVEEFASAVRNIRGWNTPLQVGIEFNDRVSMRDYFSKQLSEEYTPLRLEGEGLMMKWFGFLPDEADYKENILNMQVSSTAAFYDPKKKLILLGDWLHPVLAEAILVHELVHAFQDVSLGLDTFLGPGRLKNDLDTSFAYRSLLEGEAAAVMMEYLLRKDGKSFKDSGDVFTFIEDTLLKKSQYMRENIVYNIYGYGANFIQSFLKQKDWDRMDDLFKAPPHSMQQIMHPYSYVSGASGGGRANIAEAEFEGGIFSSWEHLYDARAGEFFLSLSLRQYLDRTLVEQAVSGWKNDRLRIYGKDGRRLIVFVTAWDSPKDSEEFFNAYYQWMKARFPGAGACKGRDRIFLKTAGKEKFSCVLNNDTVMIVWGKGFDAGEFASFINKMKAGSQPKT